MQCSCLLAAAANLVKQCIFKKANIRHIHASNEKYAGHSWHQDSKTASLNMTIDSTCLSCFIGLQKKQKQRTSRASKQTEQSKTKTSSNELVIYVPAGFCLPTKQQ